MQHGTRKVSKPTVLTPFVAVFGVDSVLMATAQLARQNFSYHKAGCFGNCVAGGQGVRAGGFAGTVKSPCCWKPPAKSQEGGPPPGLLQRPLLEPQKPPFGDLNQLLTVAIATGPCGPWATLYSGRAWMAPSHCSKCRAKATRCLAGPNATRQLPFAGAWHKQPCLCHGMNVRLLHRVCTSSML